MNRGKSIRIYLAEGAVTGIRHGEIVNWTGQALVVPRSRYGELSNWEEAAKPGVYFLFGEDDQDGTPLAYIGEAENVGQRLGGHVKGKEFWNEAVLFTNKDQNLTKAHVRYLEARLIDLAGSARRYRLENSNQQQIPSLPRGDRDAMEDFLDNLRLLLGALGHRVLEPVAEPEGTAGEGGSKAVLDLTMRIRDIEATAQLTDEGVVVLPGSWAEGLAKESLSEGYARLRYRLIEQGALEPQGNHYRFAKAILFSSPSAAGSVIAGQPCNGREYWKDGEGRSLKALEEAGSGEGDEDE